MKPFGVVVNRDICGLKKGQEYKVIQSLSYENPVLAGVRLYKIDGRWFNSFDFKRVGYVKVFINSIFRLFK